MTNREQSAFFGDRAIYFFERARNYQELGLVRIADELKEAARNFAQASAYLDQPGIRDLAWEVPADALTGVKS